ncbi:hypothetical protein LMH87_010957 [Akanthomyces muscarius]|uniref:Uncharacterized protein n=1 Tax=Akanthomyces muscarius TaxID=2231603 RepID=A0A9W8QAK6_AKAMU|nr:hypothetical protein LMH87_010957 [Akanthomyces muscarius]KAJ4150195.1 hypothetical protein LMH87_010957 [Akanthomyces muscarius]
MGKHRPSNSAGKLVCLITSIINCKGLGAGLCLRVGRQYTFICKLQVVKEIYPKRVVVCATKTSDVCIQLATLTLHCGDGLC